MSNIQSKLDYAEAVANWLIKLGQEEGQRGELEGCLRYTHIAGYLLSRQNRILSSESLEANLRLVASRLPIPIGGQDQAWEGNKRDTCLHVLSEAFVVGGHTAMAIRWMKND